MCSQSYSDFLISFSNDPIRPPSLPLHPLSTAVSVLERMLLLDPESRATAAEALTLPYFSDLGEAEDETQPQPYDHSLDNAELTLDQWKRKDTGTFQVGGR